MEGTIKVNVDGIALAILGRLVVGAKFMTKMETSVEGFLVLLELLEIFGMDYWVLGKVSNYLVLGALEKLFVKVTFLILSS